MIVASLLLVIAAAVTLLIGLLNREVIEWVYASIACCLLAGLLLTIGVLRSRPSRKPVLQSGGEGQGASWAGASQWGQPSDDDAGSGDVMTRDEDEGDQSSTVRVTDGQSDLQGDDEPTRTDMPGSDEPSPWAPAEPAAQDTGEIPDVRLVPPSVPVDDASAPPAEPLEDTTVQTDVPFPDPDDDVEIVPKPSARTDSGADSGWDADDSALQGTTPPPPAPAAAGRGAAGSTSDDAARFEQVLSPIAGVGPGKRAALLQHFGTYRKLRAASPEKLAEVPGVSRTLAQRIHDALHAR